MAARRSAPDDSPLPAYKQVRQGITAKLKSGEWKEGQLVPPEPELSRMFGVSLGTLRKAVDELVAEKILIRKQGCGTFVMSQTHEHMLDMYFRIVRKDGDKQFPVHDLKAFRVARPDTAAARSLGLTRDDRVFLIESLIHLHGRPAMFDRIVLPCALFPDLNGEIFRNRGRTTFGLYQSRYGVTVVRAAERLTAVTADPTLAQWLGVAPGSPLLEIQRTAFTFDDRPVEFRRRLVETSTHCYLNEIGGPCD
jgi:GntR family transcriptional regulator